MKPQWSLAADDRYTEPSSKAPPLAKKRPLPRGTVAEAPSARAPITPGVAACTMGLEAITPGVAAPRTPPLQEAKPMVMPPPPPRAPPDWVYAAPWNTGESDAPDDVGGSSSGGKDGGGRGGGGGGGAPNSGWKIKAASIIIALVDDCYVDAGKGPMTAKELAKEWVNSPQLQMDLERVRHKKARTHR